MIRVIRSLARNAGKGRLKELAVNRVDNELEHDRIPLFIEGDESTASLRDDFKIRENGFVRELLESTRPYPLAGTAA
jgi:hypothetical protein